MTGPLPLEEAQRRLLALARPLQAETLGVDQALGRFLAADLRAARTQPSADLSAMDGYALAGTGPWSLVGESRAGHPFAGCVEPGSAVRISTGAAIPQGATTVLVQEDARSDGSVVQLAGEMPLPGHHIRRAGFDFGKGDCVLAAGDRLTPAALALVLASGHAEVPVHRAPQVAIIDSGDELAADPAACAPGQVPASNGTMLAAMLAGIPCSTRRIGPVADDLRTLACAFDEARDADVIVSSGGASVGDHDLVRPALEALGAEMEFWRVAIRPGKPLLVARRGDRIVLGLPGNPASSFVTAFLFLLPLVRALAGSRAPLPPQVMLPLAGDAPQGGPRREFLRAVWTGAGVKPLDERDSSALRSLAIANALIDRPPHSEGTKAGTPVPVYLLENGGIA